MSASKPLPQVFDDSHHAATLLRKLWRAAQLGPRYYFWDLPRYFAHRRARKLPCWDGSAFTNPLREFRPGCRLHWELPPGYQESLQELAGLGLQLTMPRPRVEALVRAWWQARPIPGEVIECGAYRGATSLLLALLGRHNHLNQKVLILDTFFGMPPVSGYDLSRHPGEFRPPADQVELIHRQAKSLGVADRIEVHQGLFNDTFSLLQQRELRFSFVHIDANIYQGTLDACVFTIPRVAPGGLVVFDDYNGVCDLGARLAIDEFLLGRGLRPQPLAATSAYVRLPDGESSMSLWLSVILPTYNGAGYLDKTLESIAAQGDDGVEVIAVDDGSTDETLTILDRYRSRLQLRVESRRRIGNWVANSNYGLGLARAEHACYLHQDDLWLPGRLRALRPLLDRGPSPVMVLHPSQLIDARGQFLGLWRCPLRVGWHAPGRAIERLLVQNFIAIPAPIFSRQAALAVGGLDEELWYAADWDFWLKMMVQGPTVYHPKPLAAFRVHNGSQTMQGVGKAAEMRRQLDLVLERHLLPWQQQRPDCPEVGAAARLSVQLNYALAGAVCGLRPNWQSLVGYLLELGLSGCHRFLRDSRIVERVLARLRANW